MPEDPRFKSKRSVVEELRILILDRIEERSELIEHIIE
eukprot:CAMPEP_0202962346 /NCGR_PEP_ID=MMETSP1396-20130829/6455_1 /ASSEMBLY_ACC=CAM_ASM_000872 /TAXON_ID= /ORGANISM="Pseudokeronopsis sp., Strain Brazil" /LENGTH=37 /DNA_ID= /DNA_START= /DNA_END= /DNA_ORIENTATION=